MKKCMKNRNYTIREKETKMKKLFCISAILIILIALQGCGNIQLSAKEVRIELGNEAPEDIADYVSIEDKYREKFEQNAVLDLSGIDVDTVGEYRAVAAYKGEKVIIPVIVEDTTPPEIWLKDTCFREGDEVRDNEMVYIRDLSDVDIRVEVDGIRWVENCVVYPGKRLKVEAGGISRGRYFIVYPGMTLKVEAEDAYGNCAVKELRPYIREKEEKGIAGESRIISSTHAEEMFYANEEAYLALREAYGQIEWENEFETGDLKTYGSYREKFRELIENKKPFYNRETGEWSYLDEYRKKDVYYFYYFFDMNSDGVPELGIQNGGMLSFFKYDEDKDQFFLWGEWYDYKMNGSGVLRREDIHAEAERYDFCQIDENGNATCKVWFRIWCYFDGEIEDMKEVYIMTFPEYADRENEIPDDIKKQGYNYYGTYLFRVTEEQYNELTKGYFAAVADMREHTAESKTLDVSYRYEELWGNDGTE